MCSIPVSKEACKRVGRDGRDRHVLAEPGEELAQVPQVGLSGALAPAVGPELRLKPHDCRRELHGVASFQSDYQATSMNASPGDTVKAIMRRNGPWRNFSASADPHTAREATIQALSAPM